MSSVQSLTLSSSTFLTVPTISVHGFSLESLSRSESCAVLGQYGFPYTQDERKCAPSCFPCDPAA